MFTLICAPAALNSEDPGTLLASQGCQYASIVLCGVPGSDYIFHSIWVASCHRCRYSWADWG